MSPPQTRPTNKQSMNTYLSIRVTLPHDEWPRIESTLQLPDTYVAYPHVGTKTEKPHFHIFIPAEEKKEGEKYRARLSRGIGGGNAVYSVKFWANGIGKGLWYGRSKQVSDPICKGGGTMLLELIPDEEEEKLLNNPDSFYDPTGVRKRLHSEDHNYIITYRNLEKVTFRYWRKNLSHRMDITLGQVLTHMSDHGDWRLAIPVIRQGIPDIFYTHFQAMKTGGTAYDEAFYERIKRVITYDPPPY